MNILMRSIRAAALLSASSFTTITVVAQQDAPAPAASPQPAPVERSNPPLPPPPLQGPALNGPRGRILGHEGMQRGLPGGLDRRELGGEFRILPPGMWWRDSGLVQRIGLTADQTKKMDNIFQQSRLQLVDLKANLEKQELILEPMLNANPVDQGKAMAQIERVAQARADLEKANAKMLLAIRGVLTPEQWTRIQTGEREPGRNGPGGLAGDGPGRHWTDEQRGRGARSGAQPSGPGSRAPQVSMPPGGFF